MKNGKCAAGIVLCLALIIVCGILRFAAVDTGGNLVRRDAAVATLNGGDGAWVWQQTIETANHAAGLLLVLGAIAGWLGVVFFVGLIIRNYSNSKPPG